ncbi:GTP cyclohydrolase FolE2 [Treponema phagedenis]|nr:GTP cyclohydrolase FolE2 [Treponema phagedenis]EFW36841.1 TIGR00294 family protein [Treponema phagedenis F0421]NVP24027.1 GTP cyclohydrolase I FolE2 [Treponema phagedenis]QKS91249.1 GTP cyclohydrolase I FolE2 [Treponema phagedenis]QLC59557.1 GTP cyclohydrolase I FolE2 [Treponema phagedenis]CEM62089.1 GTP cyclohydrolase FolE2 [Treponema phagedenis]
MLPDIQSGKETRQILLQQVGISDLLYPLRIGLSKETEKILAEIDFSVQVESTQRGTHMSRFIETLNEFTEPLAMENFQKLLESGRNKLHAQAASAKIRFPYIVLKKAPASEKPSYMTYYCVLSGTNYANPEKNTEQITLFVPVQTLCPCSKEISAYGAHNQRSKVEVTLQLGSVFQIEDLITCIEKAASAPLHSLLKREDEKYVTEQAYANPKFAEDLVRDICLSLPALGNFPYARVKTTNYESIHNHNAFAAAHGECKDGQFLQPASI